MNNNSAKESDECVRVGEGVVAGRVAPVPYATGLDDAVAGVPSPERMGRAVDEEGYQVVTRARGRKTNHAAGSTGREAPVAFQFSQPTEASKKRRAEEQPENASRETKLGDQIHSLKAMVRSLLKKEEERMQEIREMRREVQEVKELKAELLELKSSFR
ncbi:hypothetical protein CKM354_000785300 [Cercospora kikuchii]|uniref:Uncharacterized protein n=1 Tax=Cercospora kikuchii TaxID=84275 RepID=A0A9P3FJ31_9PEZI|nr:uncharacterized protein CKM354_000784500 [Cercospora kikuchii]XP_044659149.1 uncharacterized protein CKM354_000785300 [Cercospora kikuchii]GIZ44654.1 hypothetical protein CKM354_000784500 [Cercospora kikuchii]GIZ44662.1 hypothetical protein CKM354_000785300 [Cercospora kikuchii]